MEYLLIASFFLIAMIYASVGFGGGSSYLALMVTLISLPFETIRPAALLCNVVVVTGGTYIFYRAGHLDFRRIWPFLVVSIPMAFLGGYYPIREGAFFQLLGCTLVVAAFVLWFHGSFEKIQLKTRRPVATGAVLGGGIGFLSGMVSIGGGIFLSPLLHMLRWDEAHRISALASAFILVNSISGLAGQLSRTATLDWQLIVPLLFAVFAGGQLGSRWGARKFQAVHIRKVTAALILVAGLNILFNH